MSEIAAKAGIGVVREYAHAITTDGKQYLIMAKGDVSPLDRFKAAWNHRRWQKGERTWLLS